MDVALVLDEIMAGEVSVWLDAEGNLRISKDAPAELKELVRAHKQELIDVRRAQETMNRPRMRIVRLALGQPATAYPIGAC